MFGAKSSNIDQYGQVRTLDMQWKDPHMVLLPMTILVLSLPHCIFYFPTPFLPLPNFPSSRLFPRYAIAHIGTA